MDPIFAKAMSLYAECVKKARDLGISNKYTEEALRKLNSFDHVKYPLLKRARLTLQMDGKQLLKTRPELQTPIAGRRYVAAIRASRAALKKHEKDIPAMVAMALAYYHLGKYELAQGICDITLDIQSSCGACHLIKGFIAIKQKNGPLAHVQFKRATQRSPRLGQAWHNLGVTYLRAQNFAAALPVLQKAVVRLPKLPQAHLGLGAALRGKGKLTEAKASFLQASRLQPANAAAHYNLGILYLDAPSFPGLDKLRQYDLAVAHLTKYKRLVVALAPDDLSNEFITEAQKKHLRERKRRVRAAKREARRKAREAAKKARSKGK